MRLDYNEIGKLVKEVKKQDNSAFEKLYKLTYQRLFFLAYSILKSEEDAKDAIQESYIKIFANIHSLRDDKLFLAWANKIVYTISIRMYSKKTPDIRDDRLLQNMIDESEESDPINVMLKSEKQAILADLISQLNPDLQSTLIFKYYENLKIHQIADIMDCPRGTVKSRLNTAKRQLKTAIHNGKLNDILFVVLFSVFIKKSFTNFAKCTGMDALSIYEVLVQSLAESSVGAGVPVQTGLPNIPYGSIGTNTAVAAGGTVAGSIAVVTLGTAILSAPVIQDVSVKRPQDYFTNRNVEVSATIKAPLDMLSQVYVEDTSGNVIPVKISGDARADFEVARNGDYTIHAVSKNNKADSEQITINCIDKEGPYISSYHNTETEFACMVNDNLSGIDYDKVYGETENAEKIRPASYDKHTGAIVFNLHQRPSRLVISDLAGNESAFKVDVIKNWEEVVSHYSGENQKELESVP